MIIIDILIGLIIMIAINITNGNSKRVKIQTIVSVPLERDIKFKPKQSLSTKNKKNKQQNQASNAYSRSTSSPPDR
jgi:hypothetical protein